MYLSLNWLKDFVDIAKNITPEELADKLTIHTVEIDGVEKYAEKFKGVVIGSVLETRKHPNADRLNIAQVDIKIEVLNIVCGAPNLAKGQRVPVATVGTILPGGLEIKEADVRGEVSKGMICAEDELGLGSEHAGIMVLNGGKPGQEFSEYLKYNDVIFEVDNKSITNRPDLWGHFGMAREIASFLGTKFKEKKIKNLSLSSEKAEDELEVKLENPILCPRYMAVVVGGVKVETSPKWMQDRLIAAGMKPINNIVDITNYVMLELGQPMHAFDKNLIFNENKSKIVIRKARSREEVITLDGQKRELSDNALLITNEKSILAIAGIMGSENSGINEETKDIVLEAANFDYSSIRRTSQRLSLRTESSIRFEKSLDPNLCDKALARSIELIKEICPNAKVTSKVAEKSSFELNQGPIDLDLDFINRIIGEDIGEKKIISILESLGFEIEKNNQTLKVKIPTWRATKDITIKEDLIEEIVRIYGYDNLNPVKPKVAMSTPLISSELELEKKIKNVLSRGANLAESYNYSFVGEDQLKKLGINEVSYLELANPISSQQTLLRQTLSTNLFSNVKTNQARFSEFGLFEIGSIYLPMDGEFLKSDKGSEKLPYQEKRLGIILASDNSQKPFEGVKGIVGLVAHNFNLSVDFNPIEDVPNWAAKTCSARININNIAIGFVYLLNDQAAKRIGVKKHTAVAEISLPELYNIISVNKGRKFIPFEKYPPAWRDLSFVVNEKVLYNDIRNQILNFDKIIKSVELFDIYAGDKLGPGLKSMAFHVIYQDEKTMTAEDVDKIQKKLIEKMKDKFEATIRTF